MAPASKSYLLCAQVLPSLCANSWWAKPGTACALRSSLGGTGGAPQEEVLDLHEADNAEDVEGLGGAGEVRSVDAADKGAQHAVGRRGCVLAARGKRKRNSGSQDVYRLGARSQLDPVGRASRSIPESGCQTHTWRAPRNSVWLAGSG